MRSASRATVTPGAIMIRPVPSSFGLGVGSVVMKKGTLRGMSTPVHVFVFLFMLPALSFGQSIEVEPALVFEESVPDVEPLEYRAEITPIVWWSSFAGDIAFGAGGSFDLETIDADEPAIAAGAEARLDTERLTFALGGFHRSDSADNQRTGDAITPGGIAVPAGSRVDWDLDLTSLSATAGYRFDDLIPDPEVDLRFDVYAGVRYVDLELALDAPAGSVAFDERWMTPIVGARLRVDLPHDIDVLIDADLGLLPLGDTTTSTWSVFAGVGYQPTPNLGVRVGFRHISLDYNDSSGAGDTEFNGFLAGLYAGVVIRF
ncbi:MAG: hypothetical protein Tsb0013_07160 [Phycisphaerales bacterium]